MILAGVRLLGITNYALNTSGEAPIELTIMFMQLMIAIPSKALGIDSVQVVGRWELSY